MSVCNIVGIVMETSFLSIKYLSMILTDEHNYLFYLNAVILSKDLAKSARKYVHPFEYC